MTQVGLRIQYVNNNDESVDGIEVVFTGSVKEEVEQSMSNHYQEPVKLLFVDILDNQDFGDTQIYIGNKRYNAFTRYVDIH